MAIEPSRRGGGVERSQESGIADVVNTILDKGVVVDVFARVSAVTRRGKRAGAPADEQPMLAAVHPTPPTRVLARGVAGDSDAAHRRAPGVLRSSPREWAKRVFVADRPPASSRAVAPGADAGRV